MLYALRGDSVIDMVVIAKTFGSFGKQEKDQGLSCCRVPITRLLDRLTPVGLNDLALLLGSRLCASWLGFLLPLRLF